MATYRGVLKLGQKQFVRQFQRSYHDENWYRVPVLHLDHVNEDDIKLINKAIRARFKPESGWGKLRWCSQPPEAVVEYGPFLPGECSVMLVESISIAD